MAIDWSGYQIPGYLAAQDMRQVGHEAGSAIGALMDKGLNRQELETKNLGEGLRGEGRSYYKDNVDHSIYGSYGEWVEKEGGRYLQKAESGRNFRNVDGEYQLQGNETVDPYGNVTEGQWNTLGTKDADGVWNPYNTLNADGTQSEMTPFETHQQKNFMDDWSGGNYSYLSPQSAMKAFISKDRYRPTSNLYQDAGGAASQRRFDSGQASMNFSTPGPKGSLGWYPGVNIPNVNIPSLNIKNKGILAKLIKNIIQGNKNGKVVNNNANANVNNNANTGASIKASGLSSQNAAGYWFTPRNGGNRESISAELSFNLDENNISAADFEQKYTEYLNSPNQWKTQLNPEDWAKKEYGI